MSLHSPRVSVAQRRGLAPIDVICATVASVALLLLLMALLSFTDSKAKRQVCNSNLRGVGKALYIYAGDNLEWFPVHYVEPAWKRDATPREHGITWVGTMGSSAALSITTPTSKDKSPTSSHPSRSLFLNIIMGMSMPQQFICPSSGDAHDDLRNHGPDGGGEQSQGRASQPGISRFDFRGYDALSFGYQLPYGPEASPRLALDSRMPIVADKGPYYESGGDGLAGTKTTRDKRSAVQAPNWTGKSADELAGLGADWAPYNSRNHGGEGQNVLFVDGHVDFARTPIVGVGRDNLFTIQGSLTDPISALLGIIPTAAQAYGPLTESDSFIVP